MPNYALLSIPAHFRRHLLWHEGALHHSLHQHRKPSLVEVEELYFLGNRRSGRLADLEMRCCYGINNDPSCLNKHAICDRPSHHRGSSIPWALRRRCQDVSGA